MLGVSASFSQKGSVKRSRLEIIFSVLDALYHEPLFVTRLIVVTNTCHAKLMEVLPVLLERGFVVSYPEGRRLYYRLSGRGVELRKRVIDLLVDVGLVENSWGVYIK